MGEEKAQGLTIKQEMFCLAFLACGNASEAYRQVYDVKEGTKPESIHRQAKGLIDNVKIASRIEALKAPIIKKAQISLESHLKDLKALRDAAAGEAQYSAAISAEVSRGKASGLYTDKIDLTCDVSVNVQHKHDLSDDMLAAIASGANG